MRIELVRWGMELEVARLYIRLVYGDVFVRIPRLGQLAWNQCGLYLDAWKDVAQDPVMRH
ncbi:hypothetical protein ACFPTY_03485 [Halomonas beimenensis]|uniref:Uncharacterized protein n=1 Tax=Halomonas beimenensis TaxID=475662 RepID=A0A291P525_9GAMM|nr:hypothetical protein [Halomonas beimenensis]ATJ82024.1 hypothetical protein BEI_1037 [Halomonas beimenensis]